MLRLGGVIGWADVRDWDSWMVLFFFNGATLLLLLSSSFGLVLVYVFILFTFRVDFTLLCPSICYRTMTLLSSGEYAFIYSFR